MNTIETLRGQICDLEAYLDAETLAHLLRRVAEGIRGGDLELGVGEKVRTVRIGEHLLFELHLLQGASDVIAVEISWRREDLTDQDELVITS